MGEKNTAVPMSHGTLTRSQRSAWVLPASCSPRCSTNTTAEAGTEINAGQGTGGRPECPGAPLQPVRLRLLLLSFLVLADHQTCIDPGVPTLLRRILSEVRRTAGRGRPAGGDAQLTVREAKGTIKCGAHCRTYFWIDAGWLMCFPNV